MHILDDDSRLHKFNRVESSSANVGQLGVLDKADYQGLWYNVGSPDLSSGLFSIPIRGKDQRI